jgi:hypothetical protein
VDLDTITVQDFKDYFRRDFPYSPQEEPHDGCCDLDKYVFNFDIEKAFGEAKHILNQALFGSDADIRIGYLYLTAHYLVNDLRTAQAGVNSTGSFPVSSRSVGSVSEAYQIPDMYKDSPQLAFFSTTQYGMKYLSLVLPRLIGNVGVVAGWTLP